MPTARGGEVGRRPSGSSARRTRCTLTRARVVAGADDVLEHRGALRREAAGRARRPGWAPARSKLAGAHRHADVALQPAHGFGSRRHVRRERLGVLGHELGQQVVAAEPGARLAGPRRLGASRRRAPHQGEGGGRGQRHHRSPRGQADQRRRARRAERVALRAGTRLLARALGRHRGADAVAQPQRGGRSSRRA